MDEMDACLSYHVRVSHMGMLLAPIKPMRLPSDADQRMQRSWALHTKQPCFCSVLRRRCQQYLEERLLRHPLRILNGMRCEASKLSVDTLRGDVNPPPDVLLCQIMPVLLQDLHTAQHAGSSTCGRC